MEAVTFRVGRWGGFFLMFWGLLGVIFSPVWSLKMKVRRVWGQGLPFLDVFGVVFGNFRAPSASTPCYSCRP
jgi:hypothetical protein